MKFLGYEITVGRQIEAAEKATKKGVEVGDSGTEILNGIVSEEYNTKLRDTRGVKIYDEMRASDGTIKAVILSTSLPIRRAKWFVKAADESEQAAKIAEFVENNLFEWMTISWADFLRQSLLCLPLGVMVFEKVFESRTWNGTEYITWKKFAPRMPKSIQKWETESGELGIQQRKQDGNLVDIPMAKLLVFVNEMEGDNWWGTSILRAAYKHWFIKNNFYRIDNIAFERQGLGVPYAKMPENFTDADRAKAETVLKNLRANHMAYIIEPHDYEIGFKDMQAKTVRDPMPSVQHHNREIVKSVLAQFLELGATDSGSRALSEDQSELFLQAIEAIAEQIAGTINKHAIKQLVDLNFGEQDVYPELTFTGISRADVEKLANAYSTLIMSEGIKAGEADEQYFRELLGLPERDTSNDGQDEPGDHGGTTDTGVDEEDIIDEVGMSDKKGDIKKKIYPERTEIAASINKRLEGFSDADGMAMLKRNIVLIEHHFSHPKSEHQKFFSAVRAELTAALNDIRKRTFAESNDFKGYRALTFAEKKVDFKSLQLAMDKFEAEFERSTQLLLESERKKYISALTKAVEKGDRTAIKNATMRVKRQYEKILKKSMKDAYEYGKNNAAKEMGVSSPTNLSTILTQIDVQADAIAELHIAQITNESKTKLTEALAKGNSNVQALAAADAAAAALIRELTRDTSRIVMSGYINHGRDTVFEAHADKIYAKQRSEILDASTCNYCLSVDGRIVEKDDPFSKNTIFHSGCRGIWVEILLDEEDLPAIGGIPKSLRDRFGDAVNDLIQPRTPTNTKDALARKEIERRAKRKKK